LTLARPYARKSNLVKEGTYMFFKGLDKEYWNSLLKASLIGIHLVTTSIVGLAAGYFLDKWLGTTPWLTMILFFLGLIGGFQNMFREVRSINKSSDTSSKSSDGQKDKPEGG